MLTVPNRGVLLLSFVLFDTCCVYTLHILANDCYDNCDHADDYHYDDYDYEAAP